MEAAEQTSCQPPAEAPGPAELAAALQAQYASRLAERPSPHFLARIPIAFARRHAVLALESDNGVLPVALASLDQWAQMQIVGKILGKHVRPFFAPREEILRAIDAGYQQAPAQTQRLLEEIQDGSVVRLGDGAGNEDLLDLAHRAPVIQLVNMVLLEAVKRRASDVHVQPYEGRLIIRFRVDGVLYDIFEPPDHLSGEIVSRLKVMGGMDIAERRLAQDGRATVEVGSRRVDLRIATLPTSFGERVVVRLLDKNARLYRLGELGMPQHVLEPFRGLIRHDHGMILVTGPTGSGKSTTLYAALQELDCRTLNVLTLEDPIEYRLEGISQTQIHDKKGMTFATGLRHVLRQDPDVIMVGEIRDGETARMAIQSALTGHLVFSTLHTNDAASAVARLLDLGVEPYLLASSLLGVLAQRLVRRICPTCTESYVPGEQELQHWRLSAAELPAGGRLQRGTGCECCFQSGYRERMGIFELLVVHEGIREQILHRPRASAIKAAAQQEGMRTLRSDGVVKALAGLTTMDEVIRVSSREEF